MFLVISTYSKIAFTTVVRYFVSRNTITFSEFEISDGAVLFKKFLCKRFRKNYFPENE